MEQIQLVLPFPSIFYAPVYVAQTREYFQRNKVQVQFSFPELGGDPVGPLEAGHADVAVGGPVRLMRSAPASPEPCTIIGQVTGASGFSIVGRQSAPFQWSDLAGKTYIPFTLSKTPLLFTRSRLRKNQVDPDAMQIREAGSPDEAVATFLAGDADFAELPEPYVSTVLAAGSASVCVSMARELGAIPFSVIITRRELIEQRRGALQCVLAGVQAAQAWIRDASAQDVAAELSGSFPGIDLSLLEPSAARYKDEGVWASEPAFDSAPFIAMQETIMQGGEELRMLSFEDSVDNSLNSPLIKWLFPALTPR